MTISIVDEINKECLYCDKKATHQYCIRYGFALAKVRFGIACKYHARLIQNNPGVEL